jgi:poly(3-hydroxybutyrate) depolymerase
VVLDAGLLPRRAYAAGLIGQALVASALGHGHRRIAAGLAVPAGTVRGWIRGARRSAALLRITGIRVVLASGHDELLAWQRTDELGGALEHLAAAARVTGHRYGLEHTSWWARINVLTRGRLLTMAPAG